MSIRSIRARAVTIQSPGGPEALTLGEIELRSPGPTEVLVEIKAAGLNRADCLQRRGVYPPPPGVIANVPGLEYAGVVAEVGAEVRRHKVGDKVMAICAGGSMASHIVAHEGELLPVPGDLSLTDAAAIPEVFMTAFDALILQGKLGLGQHALLHAVGSGVGTAALQLTLAIGAIPIGTSRKADKLARLAALGLRHGIHTAEGKFADQVRSLSGGRLANVILDTVGGKYLAENVKAAAPEGTIITIGMLGGVQAELPLGLLVAKRLSLRGSVLRSRSLGEKLELARSFTSAVLPLFATGVLKPIVEDVMPMTEIQQAHARMESDDLFGKLVLRWD
jgi:putative PIG3 family NAD(P)H quinone oxidoreductase